MARFYRIQLDDIYLTDSGLEDGDAWKLDVAGADELLLPYSGSTIISVDKTPINQTFETDAKGTILEIRLLALASNLWEDIVTLIRTATPNQGTINIKGTGSIGNFDVTAKPLLPRPFEATEFKGERIKNVIFRFITT